MILRTIKNLFTNHFMLSAIIGAVLMLVASSVFAATHTAEMKFTESGTDLDRISVENVNGDIEVTGTNGTTVEITANIKIEGDSKAVQAYAEEFMPKITRSDGRLSIKTHRPEKDDMDDDIENSSISYVISLPKSFGVRIESVNGDMTIADTYGQLAFETVNGDIEVKSMDSDSKDFDIETVNGDVEIKIQKLTGDFDYESVNGDVELSISKTLEANIKLETVNGDMELKIPAASSFTLDAESAMGGDIKTDWGQAEGVTFIPGEELEIEVNGGKNKIDIETVNGSVEVRKID
jgi:DUF4097 and DUF4098 domain-containing protein YvlB